jgi:hypothetical protein
MSFRPIANARAKKLTPISDKGSPRKFRAGATTWGYDVDSPYDEAESFKDCLPDADDDFTEHLKVPDSSTNYNIVRPFKAPYSR